MWPLMPHCSIVWGAAVAQVPKTLPPGGPGGRVTPCTPADARARLRRAQSFVTGAELVLELGEDTDLEQDHRQAEQLVSTVLPHGPGGGRSGSDPDDSRSSDGLDHVEVRVPRDDVEVVGCCYCRDPQVVDLGRTAFLCQAYSQVGPVARRLRGHR